MNCKRIITASIVTLFSFCAMSQNWNQIQKIVASDRKISQHFSKSVDISGNYAFVGAHREGTDEHGMDVLPKAGAAYIFEKQTNGNWLQIQKIVASDRNTEDNFGTSISVDGNIAVVGAYKRDTTIQGVFYSQVGAAYVFEKDVSGEWNEVQKLIASDMDSLNFFGKSVAISGNNMVIGAAFRDTSDFSGTVPQAGAAYFFERNNQGVWEQQQKVVASDFEAFSIFGWSVAISGNYAVIGAYKENENSTGLQPKTNAGAAYIFERINGIWTQVDKLTASDRNNADWFGYNVAISGNTAVVGAYQEDNDVNGDANLSNAGAAYIFERDVNGNWVEIQKIVASDRNTEDWFGYALDISNDYIVVGARQEDEDSLGGNTMPESGSAYVYHKNTIGNWQEVQKLTSSDRGGGDWFGFSVSIDDSNCLIGAFSDKEDENGNNILAEAGSVYVFELNTTTGIYPQKIQKQIGVYPNPAQEMIKLTGYDINETICIYNALGEIVYQSIYKNQTINISEFQNGIYYVKQGKNSPVKFVKY